MARKKLRLQADNLVQGISQQVPSKQTLNHCADRRNIVPSIVHGNTKRPSLRFDARLNLPVRDDMAEHFYTRDADESYLLVNTGDDIRAFDRKTWEQATVNAPEGYDYLSSPNSPAEDFCFLTLGDYTLVCNKTKVVKMMEDKTPAAQNKALLYVTQGDYATTYKVFLEGTLVATLTTSEEEVEETATDFIVQQLRQQIVEFLGGTITSTPSSSVKNTEGFDLVWSGPSATAEEVLGIIDNGGEGGGYEGRGGTKITVDGNFLLTYTDPQTGSHQIAGKGPLTVEWDSTAPPLTEYAGNISGTGTFTATWSSVIIPETADAYTITGDGSVITIARTDGEPFTLTATDSINNDAIKVVMGAIQRFEDLPPRAPDGYAVKVTQSSRVDEDDYYVTFRADDPSNTESVGVWVETLGDEIHYALDASTMPHFLIREADGSFTFRPGDWDEREAGDEKSVPNPSFVGRTINWMYFFQNRIGFLTGSSKIEGRTSDYFNFWRKSARTRLDTDPVDLAATTSEALKLHYAYPFDQKLVIFADDTQLICTGGATYTPATAAMEVASQYEMDPRTAPVVVGKSLFFTVRQGRYSSVMEMQGAEGNTDKLYAVEVTEHVPHYLPQGRYKMIASAKANMLLMIDPSGDQMWVYNWLWADRARVISSWHHFRFAEGAPVWTGMFSANRLQLLTVKGDDTPIAASITFDENGRYLESLEDAHLDFLSQGQLTDDAGDTIVEVPLYYTDPVVLGVQQNGAIREVSDLVTDWVPLPSPTMGNSATHSFRLPGVWEEVIVGELMDVYHVFSEPFPVKYGPRGEMMADLRHRIQLTNLTLNITDTGPFEVTVKKPHRPERTERFTGLSLGNKPSTVDGAPISSGSFKVNLRGQSQDMEVTLRSRTWMPLCLTGAEWSGSLIRKL